MHITIHRDQLAPVQSSHDFFPEPPDGRAAAQPTDGHGGPRLNSRGPGSLAAARPLPARYGSNQMLAAEDSPGMRRDVFAPWPGQLPLNVSAEAFQT